MGRRRVRLLESGEGHAGPPVHGAAATARRVDTPHGIAGLPSTPKHNPKPQPQSQPNPNPNPNQVSLGYRRTLCRDNSTRRRCYRWLREDVGEAPARHTKSGNSRGIPSDEVCGWSSA